MRVIDTHCHLFMDPLGRDPAAALRRAEEAEVETVVVPAYDEASWPAVQALARHDAVRVAYGLHPWVAVDDLDIGRLAELLAGPSVVALGEVGLDFALPSVDRQRQVYVLSRQLELARELNLPVILHCRKAFDELIRVLQRHGPALRGVVHAYSRGPTLARQLTEELGLLLAFGGAITRPGAKRARRSAQVVSLDKVLLETDAPSIGLHGVEPEDVEPRHVAPVAAALAEQRGLEVEQVAAATTRNAEELFGLSVR